MCNTWSISFSRSIWGVIFELLDVFYKLHELSTVCYLDLRKTGCIKERIVHLRITTDDLHLPTLHPEDMEEMRSSRIFSIRQ